MNLTPITIQGKQFMCGTSRFMVRGIAMSADAVLNTKLKNISDILSEEHSSFMSTDVIPKLVQLNVNCIRVYQVNPDNSHKTTMNNLEANGIYVMVGLATPYNSVKQMTGEYSQGTFVHAARVVDEFQKYDNTFCFSVGNEVEFPGQMAANLKAANPTWEDSTIVTNTVQLEYKVAQSMKSFARDVKAYISTNKYRTIPVGVAMQDGPQSAWGGNNPQAYQQGLLGTDTIARYYTSGNADEIMDFIGINTYRYVTGGAPAGSAYSGLANNEAVNYPVPVFLTESGGLPTPNGARDWADVPTLYPGYKFSGQPTQYYEQLSGQIAFQMMEEGAGYGIYVVNADNTLTSQFTDGSKNLAAQFKAVAAIAMKPALATPVVPATAPSSVTPPQMSPITLNWPALLPLKKFLAANAIITLNNYATCDVLIIQQGGEIARVPAASSAGPPVVPTTVKINVLANSALNILGNTGTSSAPTWVALCGVPAASVVNGATIGTNVQWGTSAACPVTVPQVNVTVKNYSTGSSINVVQNNNVMGTVAAASSPTTPATAVISVSPGVEILLQGPAPGYAACCMVPAASVAAGITISNNVQWGNGSCNLG